MKTRAAKPNFFRQQHHNWQGPGWYWVKTGLVRCPRGCCDDDIITFATVQERIDEVREEMTSLASMLREARQQTGRPEPGKPKE